MSDTWSEVWTVVQEELSIPSAADLTRTCIRLLVAVLLGALVGFDRERKESAAGLRTHMLVALGAALFVIVAQQAGMDKADLSRVLQGVVAGIGFLGAGAIIKLSEKEQVKGLTTAASIWATAALPRGGQLGVYQPRHARPATPDAKTPKKTTRRVAKKRVEKGGRKAKSSRRFR